MSREEQITAIKAQLADLSERIRLARFIREYRAAMKLNEEYDELLDQLFILLDQA